jgi:glucan 1,3-beta-glucosidase
MTIVDATVTDTGVFVRTPTTNSTTLPASLVINNAELINTPVAVGVNVTGEVVLAGGTLIIASWAQGNVYSGLDPFGSYVQDHIRAPHKPSVLLDGAGKIFGKGHPQYADYAVGQFVSVRSNGAKGDGVTDDTAALTSIFSQAWIPSFTAIFPGS